MLLRVLWTEDINVCSGLPSVRLASIDDISLNVLFTSAPKKLNLEYCCLSLCMVYVNNVIVAWPADKGTTNA